MIRIAFVLMLLLASCGSTEKYYLVEREYPIEDTIMLPAIHYHTDNNECVYVKEVFLPFRDTIRISYYERR